MEGPRQVNVHEAKTRLSQLLAEVEGGQEIVVARNGTPVAKLVPFPKLAHKRLRVDTWKGRIQMSPDFDTPLSEDDLREWGY